MVGWHEAAERLLELPWLDLELQLGPDSVVITDASLSLEYGQFGIEFNMLRYRLKTQLLLFSQENYRHYKTLNETERRAERDRLLVANLLASLRGLNITFPAHLVAGFIDMKSCSCVYKGTKIMGFTGEFLSNALLPNGFAFGRAVSHGFGELQIVLI